MAPDSKQRDTDCANTETLFRIIQSIPSPRAEPFKRWLAQVGYERVNEIENPELASARARELYQTKSLNEFRSCLCCGEARPLPSPRQPLPALLGLRS